ncbi:MAG TPA: four helix bundle protein [Chitinophagaceae bacterium]|nr:four helix bundle protein [Chitinophagaceae bacterium]
MFLHLAHTTTDVFRESKKFVLECYRITRDFPAEEKYAMVQQIRRAAMSVHLNIAEGCSKRSGNERKRFYEIARGSLIEADAALDLVLELKYKTDEELQQVGSHLVSIFRQLSGLIGKWAPPQ